MIWTPRRRPVPFAPYSRVTITDASGTVLRVIDPPAGDLPCLHHEVVACRRCLLTADVERKYRRRTNPS